VVADIGPKGARVWTDKDVYVIGETVTYYVYVLGGFTEYFLVIIKPDGTTIHIDLGALGPGTYSFTATAGPPPGQRQVLLYGYGIPWRTEELPSLEPVLLHTYYFTVIGGPADLMVYKCWVSPANPKQEQDVTLYAIIANAGGSDANGFRVEVYVDGSLYESSSLSLRAGEEEQVSARTPWRGEDGSHQVVWFVNPDRSVEETNYGNNEAGCSFIVSPWTETWTEYATFTKTKTQTEKYTLTTTTTTYKGALTTETITKTITITGKAITRTITLTGLYIRTSYSPTVTITVTQTGTAQISSLPLLLSLVAFTGTIIYRRRSRNRRREE
jgi:hypothetical protein